MLYQLTEAGYQAYLVGGGARHLLLQQHPKEIDIATDATPEQVKAVFSNCRLIGRRFRLAHVYFGREIIEVATFRSAQPSHHTQHQTDSGMILRDNAYGSIEEDALRRDFTINALYYNIRDFSVIDYADGVADLQAGVIRLLGDPATRYREDPVRMLRAARFAAKLGFHLAQETEAPLWTLAYLLKEVPPARLFEEIQKLFMGGTAQACFSQLRHYGLFQALFPQTESCLQESTTALALLEQGLRNTDQRIKAAQGATPAFLFAVFLWAPVQQRFAQLQKEGLSDFPAIHQAASEVLEQQLQQISLPRRFSVVTRNIWVLQLRLPQIRGKRPLRLLAHPSFRAAYDFLLLRTQAGEGDQALADWWTDFQQDKAPIQKAPKARQNGRSQRNRKDKAPS